MTQRSPTVGAPDLMQRASAADGESVEVQAGGAYDLGVDRWDPDRALAERLWITGPAGPYSRSQWLGRLVLAFVDRTLEARGRCTFR